MNFFHKLLSINQNSCRFANLTKKVRFGEMAEWSKAHAWKVCKRHKRFMGSNPILSAINIFFCSLSSQKKAKFNTMAWDKKLFSKIMTIFGFTMVAVFFGIGVTLAFFPVYSYLPREIRIIFGCFFMAYGFFRLARIIQQIREQKREEY
jgi:hypothetical protein